MGLPLRVWRDIVSDRTRRGLPSIHPDQQSPPPGSGWRDPVALKPPAGIGLIDKMCAAADAQDRLAKVESLARTIAALEAGQEAEIARLRAEVVRLEAELKKAGK